jgi:hypothetical protein
MSTTILEKHQTAKRTTKPKAVAPLQGRKKSALNSLKHGALSARVLPHERLEFEAFASQMRESLNPQSALEDFLCERITLTAWRLRRLENWEGVVLAKERRQVQESTVIHSLDRALEYLADREFPTAENIKEPIEGMNRRQLLKELQALTFQDAERIRANLDDAREHARSLRAEFAEVEAALKLKGFEGLRSNADLPPSEDLLNSIGNNLLSVIEMKIHYQKLFDETDQAFDWEGLTRAVLDAEPTGEQVNALQARDWTFKNDEVYNGIAFIQKRFDVAEETLKMDILFTCECQVFTANRIEACLSRYEALEAEDLQAAMMLDTKELERVTRYESHLERVLYKALHELEAVQARGRGENAPLARVELHGGDLLNPR